MASLTKKITSSALITLLLAPLLTGCATSTNEQSQASTSADEKTQRDFPEYRKSPTNPKAIAAVYDPLEPFNRSMYNFNTVFDRYLFLPVVHGYEYVTPDLVETGVTNFFSNLGEIRSLINNVLQGELTDTGVTTSRFVINTTVGVLGVWDPATRMGLYQRKEDFGQTLGKWGVGNGPYLVLPIFGPSTLRDTGGLVFDTAAYNAIDPLDLNDDANKDGIRVSLNLLQAIDARKNTKFHYYETGSPFEYSLVRYMYIEMRNVQIEK